ncbi:MAG: 6-phosphofructokinase [Oscillospiraceae bacterium]|nr:6-phosphofructokinase [Oscillospiraceae bacterium]MCL2278711.1 6-phosphofructokinase [Oscillospiraceae bacterium]
MSEKLKGAAVFGQSGGPTSVINASAYGVIKAALDAPEITKVYGMAHGIVGLLNDTLYDMGEEDPEELKLLLNTPSSALGSCRYKLKSDEDLAKILEMFKKYDIRYFFYNGGNDSMDTCSKISDYMSKVGYDCRVMGVPKTIDNDLVGTDHCPGFGSAAKYIATSIAEIHKDAYVYDTGAITIVEIMGRNAGWLTGSAALAELSDAPPDLIYLPELLFDMDAFLTDVEAVYKKKTKCLVAISEGAQFADGTFISQAKASATDGFGHAQLGGTATRLALEVNKKLGVRVRGIELSLLQRCAAHIASQTDIDEAFLAGKSAVEYALSGGTGKMVIFTRESENGKYKCGIDYEPLSICANKEKKIPREWITKEGTYVTRDFIDYVLPLIQGDNTRKQENGLPRFAKLKKVKV